MRFTMYFFAFLVFICSWILNQVFGARNEIKVVDCEPEDLFCGVELSIYRFSYKLHRTVLHFKEGLTVLRSLLVLEDNTLAPCEIITEGFPWDVKCIGQFCVASYTNSVSKAYLAMNFLDPMVDKGRIDFKNPGNDSENFYFHAFPVPDFLPVPKFKYDCKNKKECEASISAYGASAFTFNLKKKKLTTFKTFLALNGVGGCFDEYCTFVDAKSLEVKANFYTTHYYNFKPKELEFNQKNELVVNNLIERNNPPQVVINIKSLPDFSSFLKCGYSVYNEQNSRWDNTDGLTMSLPPTMSSKTFSPIRKFKAANGVGACAGAFCCFRKDNDETYYVNFQGTISDSVRPSPWYSHNHTTNLENLFLYTDTSHCAVGNPEPQERDPGLTPVVDGSRVNTIDTSQKTPENYEVSIILLHQPGSNQKQTEPALVQDQYNVIPNVIARTDKVKTTVVKGQSNVHPNHRSITDRVKLNSSIQTNAVHFILSSLIALLSVLMTYY